MCSGTVKFHHLSDEEKMKYLGDFFSIISSLDNRKDVKNFFKDLLTLSEIVMISRRLQIAKRLLKGHSYREIQEDLKVGTSTINHVEKWLNNGFNGYKTVIKKYNKLKQSKRFLKMKKDSENVPDSFRNIMKNYPGHFMLLDLFEDK